MKQNLKSSGQIELNEMELEKVVFHYVKEDRNFIFKAIRSYLKSLHKFELENLHWPLGKDTGGRVVAKCQVVSLQAGATSLPVILTKKEGGGHKKPNQGFYTVLMTILQAAYKKSKKPLDANEVFEEMKFELPNLAWRNFTIYVSDKRRQASSGYVYDGKRKLIRATRSA